jgi:hypothetical protein
MNKVKVLSFSIGAWLAFIGLSAVVSGAGLIVNPEGGMGLAVSQLKNTPFSNYLIPGIVLLVVNGAASLAVSVMAFRIHRYTGVGTLILGALLIVWIVFQVHWIGWSSWLQPTMLSVGAVEMAFGVYLNEQNPESQGMFKGHHGSNAH